VGGRQRQRRHGVFAPSAGDDGGCLDGRIVGSMRSFGIRRLGAVTFLARLVRGWRLFPLCLVCLRVHYGELAIPHDRTWANQCTRSRRYRRCCSYSYRCDHMCSCITPSGCVWTLWVVLWYTMVALRQTAFWVCACCVGLDAVRAVCKNRLRRAITHPQPVHHQTVTPLVYDL
jgi:hypothetical protein